MTANRTGSRQLTCSWNLRRLITGQTPEEFLGVPDRVPCKVFSSRCSGEDFKAGPACLDIGPCSTKCKHCDPKRRPRPFLPLGPWQGLAASRNVAEKQKSLSAAFFLGSSHRQLLGEEKHRASSGSSRAPTKHRHAQRTEMHDAKKIKNWAGQRKPVMLLSYQESGSKNRTAV